MKLSILDQSPITVGKTAHDALIESAKLAQLGEKLGYTRYWIAEHHNMPGLACPAPDIMISYIGSTTKKIRIGAGAVLLPHYKPFNVAERYNLLATLFPNRIDLGIGRAPGGSAEATMALSDNFLENVRCMPNKLDELLQFLHHDFPENHLFAKVSPTPIPSVNPDIWLLGTSEKSAILAAEKGMSYVFGHFMSDKDGPAIVNTYLNNMEKEHPLIQRKIIVAVAAICAHTMEEAEELALSNQLWKVQQGMGNGDKGVPTIESAKHYPYSKDDMETIKKMKKNAIIGDPDRVKQQLLKLKNDYQADELMIITITHSYEARAQSYELIAKEMLNS